MSGEGEPGRRADITRTDASTVTLRRATLQINGATVPWQETVDFPLSDPWSGHLRGVIRGLRERGAFVGRDILEAGLGDGRNIAVAVGHANEDTVGRIIGIEYDIPRVQVGRNNLVGIEIPKDRLAVHQGDAVGFLHSLPDSKPLSGWGIACLPQAPEGETKNSADGVRNLPAHEIAQTLDIGKHSIDDYGLSLNAAFLLELRRRAAEGDFQLLLTLSGRIPRSVREELVKKTGWTIVREHRTENPVMQDRDTGVKYVQEYADELVPEERDGFFEKRDGRLVSLPADEAEKRRAAHEEAQSDEPLNVFHDVSVYQLMPAVDAFDHDYQTTGVQLYAA